MKVIFLDIDGVLNCERAYVNGYCKYVEWTWPDGTKDHHQSFAPWCKEYLNELIELTGAKIVISSTWRHSGIDFMRKVWEIEGMKGEIIGITPNFRGDINGYNIPRGCEIDYYLKKELNFSHINWDRDIQKEYIEKTGVENYIIIDDDSDMLYGQRNHFVHVLPSPRNKDGFNKEYFTQALRMLTLSVIDLNY
jgi:hypothetical protein